MSVNVLYILSQKSLNLARRIIQGKNITKEVHKLLDIMLCLHHFDKKN